MKRESGKPPASRRTEELDHPSAMRSSDLFNLERQYTFYKAYHSNTINKRIHIVFVPLIIITTLALLSLIPLPEPATDLSRLVTLGYILYGIFLNPAIGLAFAPFLICYYLASRALCDYAGPSGTVPLAGALNFIGWFAQLLGHYAFEGRSPAFMDSIVQALLAAPIVIWIDVIFSLGFLPEMKARFLRSRVVAKAKRAVARQ